MQSRIVHLGLALSVALTIAATVACGGGGDDAPESKATAKPTEPSVQSQPTKAAPAGPTSIALIGKDILFNESELDVKAGPVTIEFDNQDAGVPHNVHVFSGSDATGESVGQTELESGPVKQTLELDLTAGEYFFVCDAHPTTMTGTLVAG